MFTGIIEKIGKVYSIEKKGTSSIMGLQIKDVNYSLGDSICINGVCLTVHTIKKNNANLVLSFDVSKETLKCTNFNNLYSGSLINLEKSLKVGDEISGHFVFGHVDTVSKLKSKKKSGKSYILEFTMPKNIRKLVTKKGSISINGISLTVNKTTKDSFFVNIVDYTWNHTNLRKIKLNDIVNIEVDMLARYVTNSKK